MRYIVWSPNGPFNPKIILASRGEAQRVAEQMARDHAPHTFFTCALTDSYRKADIQWNDLTKQDDDGEIPF